MPRLLIPAAVAAIALLPYLPGFPLYWVTLMNTIGLASLVALGLVVLTGVGGMTSFGQAAFAGFAAYATAVLSTSYGVSPWLTLPISLAVTGLSAVVLGLVTTRLSGHYLPLGTICWSIAVFYLFGSLPALGGFNGISGIPPLSVGGTTLLAATQVWPVVLIALMVCLVLTRNLLNSRTGRSIRAMRAGTAAAEAFGVNVPRAKLVIFVYAALLAGLSGWLFAYIQRGVTPTAFGLSAGIEYLLMAVLGGTGHILGAVVGAALIILLKSVLQDVLPAVFGSGGNYEVIVMGVILFVALQKMPDGVWSTIRRFLPHRSLLRGNGAAHEAVEPRPGRLEITGLTKRFGGLTAVSDVSFGVDTEEIVALLGPNGAGKSTTFNLITGVTRPSEGTVTFDGQRLDGIGSRQIAAQGIARTFQHVKLAPGMTVIDNVALGAHLHGKAGLVRGLTRLDRAEERRLMATAWHNLDRLGLTDLAGEMTENLSLGSARLVEIARSLCLSPRMLLLDEPAAGLRKFEKDALADLLLNLRAEGLGILIVEHDMDFVMRIADRIVVLNFGTWIAEGTPAEIRANNDVQTAYLGEVA